MAKSILNIVERGFRATIEEQDDTVLWISAVLRDNGIDAHILLRGSAVGYLVRAADASGLSFGDRRQTNPPSMTADLGYLLARGATIHYVEEDLAARAIAPSELMSEAKPIAAHALPELFERYDQIWAW